MDNFGVFKQIGDNVAGDKHVHYHIEENQIKQPFTNKALIIPLTMSKANGAQGGTYVPRNDLLSKIEETFKNERIIFLSGMGGCGKSELARAYGYNHRNDYDEIFWLTCDDGTTPDFWNLMEKADLTCKIGKSDTKGFSEKILIIVDNCNSESPSFLGTLENWTGEARILVTTRLSHMGNYESVIPVDSDDPETFAYHVFEKNYCKKQPWKKPKKIKDSELFYIHDICHDVQYNTMIISLIGLRLCQYDNLSIADCAQKIRTGVSSIKGIVDYSKDMEPHSEEMKDVLHFLFKDILNYPITEAQKEILSVLSLTPASWYEMKFIYSLTGGGTENTNYEYAAKKLLSFGWLQGSSDKMAIHPLIAEAISGEPIAISDPKFYCKLLNSYLGLQEEYLYKNRYLINEIIKRSDGVLPKNKMIAMLLINHGGYKTIFSECFPNITTAYFVYETHDWKRFYYYRDIKLQETCLLINTPCQTKEDDSVKLLKLYSKNVPYILDLSITINNKTIARIPAGICFEDPHIDNCIFSQHMTVIEDYAFAKCSGLSGRLHLPDGLTYIGKGAFAKCSGLSGELHLPDGLTYIGEEAFAECSGLSGELFLPNTLTTIRNEAFYGCSSLSNVHLPDALTYIGKEAFYGCFGLSAKLYLPDTLYHIGDMAFFGCTRLTIMSLPTALKYIGDRAFYGCNVPSNPKLMQDSFTNIVEAFDESVAPLDEPDSSDVFTNIGDDVIYECSNQSGNSHLQDTLTNIKDGEFRERSDLSGELRLPDGLTSIGNFAFFKCFNLSSIRLPDTLTSVTSH